MTAPITINQLGYRKPDAAKFIGVSKTKFENLVKQGRMPQPFKCDGCTVWDGRELVKAFDALKGNGSGKWVI